jgi:hypothetical protein
MQNVADRASVLDLLDRLLDKGVVARGDLLLSVADIELVTVSLAAVIASTATLDRVSGPRLWTSEGTTAPETLPECKHASTAEPAPCPTGIVHEQRAAPRQDVRIDPNDTERGLVKLVLTIVELLRQLMERQAVRRMETGTLAVGAWAGLGRAFLSLDVKMGELVKFFGLKREDLNLDLGPIGNLI